MWARNEDRWGRPEASIAVAQQHAWTVQYQVWLPVAVEVPDRQGRCPGCSDCLSRLERSVAAAQQHRHISRISIVSDRQVRYQVMIEVANGHRDRLDAA